MAGLTTSYEFTLPRGYVDPYGNLHRVGRMRLATARDELEPLRDPQVSGPDDPRLTILVLARVVEQLGELGWVAPETIENLFAVDLAFLQDFYGVINFGTQDEFDALIAAQAGQALVGSVAPAAPAHAAPERPEASEPTQPPPPVAERVEEPPAVASAQGEPNGSPDGPAQPASRPSLREAVEELPRMTL
jgi:hypothetical protein